MGRMYDAWIEVGPRFAGFSDIKKQGDAAGKEYGKALAEAAAKAAAANVRKLGEALAKARSSEADAAGKVRVAEQKLAEVRAQSNAKLSSIAAAEEALASAQRKSATASNTAKTAAESLGKAREQVAKTAESTGKLSGNRFTNAFRGALSKVDKDGAQVATRFGVGFNDVFGGIASRSAGLFAAGFAVVQGAKVFTSFINDAEESAKVSRITANAIRATGGAAKITADQVGELATSISNKTGIDDEQIQTASNMLLTFKNIRNEAGKNNDIFNQATQAAADLSVQFGGIDGASKQLGKALNDPVKGITALNKAGVTFTDSQKKQIKSMVASGDILGAQKILLQEVASQVGGAAAAASNPLDRLKVIAGNVSEQFGGFLLPSVEKFANFLSDKAAPAISGLADLLFKGDFTHAFAQAFNVSEDSGFVSFLLGARETAIKVFGEIKDKAGQFAGFVVANVVPAVKNLVTTFTPLAKEVGGAVVSAFQKIGPALGSAGSALSGLLPAFKSFTGFLRDNQTLVSAVAVGVGAMVLAFKGYQLTIIAVSAVTKAWAAVQVAFNVIMSANPIGIVALALVGLAAGLVYAYKHSETFRDIVNGAFEAVKGTVSSAIGVVKTVIGGLVTAFFAVKDAISTAIGAVVTAFDAVKTGISAAVSFVGSVWSTVIGVISGPATAVVGVLQAIWARVMPILVLPFYIAKAAIDGVWALIVAGFNAAVGFVQSVFAKAWSVIQSVIVAPLDRAWRSIVYVWALIQAGFNAAKDWVVNSFSKAWSAVSGVLTGPITAAKTWIGNRFTDITDAFTKAKDWVLDSFAKAWDAVKDKLTKPVNDAKSTITTALGAGKNGLQWVFDQAVKGIGKIWDGLQELAKAPIRFIVNTVLNDGLIGAFNWVAGKFKAPTIDPIKLPQGFAGGGEFSGRLPGRPSAVDNMLGMSIAGPVGLATGEFITNAKDTARALPLLHHINSGGDLPFGFADGGLFGKLKGVASSAFSAGKTFGSDVLDVLGDPVKWFKDRLAGPLKRMSELGDSSTAEIVKQVPRNLVDVVANKAKTLLGLGNEVPVAASGEGIGGGRNGAYGGVKPWVAAAGDLIRRMFHVGSIGGVGGRPNASDHPTGHALDFMVGKNKSQGDAIASYMLRARNQMHLSYLIWYDRIASAKKGWAWRPYTHPNGATKNPTLRHLDHVHASFLHNVPGYAKGGRFPKALAADMGVKTFDTGLKAGKWAPGTLAYNGTGKGETVRTAEQEADLKRPLMLNARIFIGTREITDIVRVEIDEKSSASARSYDL